MFAPWKTFLFLLSIFLIFLLLSILPIPGYISFNNITIKIPKIRLSQPNYQKSQKAETIIKQLTNNNMNLNDSIPIKKDSTQNTAIRSDSLYSIQVPIENSISLYSFFTSLENAEKIHVLHYGDSQIEGDRITGFLRQQFQSIFGGKGAGLIIPFKVNQIDQAISIETKGNWQRYTLFGNRNSKIKHNQYGPMLQFVRYAPPDTTVNDSLIYEASLKIKGNKKSPNRNYQFTRIQLLYGNLKRPVLAQLYIDGNFIDMKSLAPTLTTQDVNFDIIQQANDIEIEFTGKDSPDLYAINFDSETGIYFSNIPMRGSSGTDFSKNSCGQLSSIFRSLNVKLIIYQFGINIVPTMLQNYDFYENWIYQQLQYLKRCNPETSILVVGISDMTMNTDSGLVSYPNIEKIRNAQKKAAIRANCAFWDTYEAMGGNNSMQAWVKAGLANKDYTHFTYSGAQQIAKLLYQAIYNEYIHFRKKAVASK